MNNEQNKPAHPTADNVSILIRASLPAVDGLFVLQESHDLRHRDIPPTGN